MRIYLLLFFFIVLFLIPTSALSQNDSFINGVLLDTKTREPIVFATIRVKDKALGVISNQDGGFKIPVEFQSVGTILEISSMGYETKNIPIAALEQNGINTILMETALLALQETTVTASAKRLTARKIIQYALNRIPENYANDPFSLIGYYRDYQLQKNQYINLNEAIVQVFDKGFKSDDYKETEYGLFSYFKNTEFRVDSFAAKPYDYKTKDKFIPDAALISDYGGNELVILHIHDAIRNHNVPAYSFVNKLVDDFIKKHRFTAVEKTSYNGKEVYKIGIKKLTFPFQAKGFIYIDKNNFAIRKLDYAVYKKYLDATVRQQAESFDDTGLRYEILVEYTEVADEMYLNYISFHNKFNIRRPASFKVQKIILDQDNGYLEVALNKPAKNYDALKLSDFKLTYMGKEVQFEQVVRAGGNKIILKLSSTRRQIELRNLLFSKTKESKQEKLFLKITTLMDEEGNLLDERKVEQFDQFREFFTQKVVNKNIDLPTKENLMNKSIPLYDSIQPIIEQKTNTNYWMNTPLKTNPQK